MRFHALPALCPQGLGRTLSQARLGGPSSAENTLSSHGVPASLSTFPKAGTCPPLRETQVHGVRGQGTTCLGHRGLSGTQRGVGACIL